MKTYKVRNPLITRAPKCRWIAISGGIFALYRVRYGAGGALNSGTVPAHFTVCDGLRCLEYSANAAL